MLVLPRPKPLCSALLDTCAIYGACPRDTLFRSYKNDLYRLVLSDTILEELYHSQLEKGMSEEKAANLIKVIRTSFPETIVTDYHHLIPSMPINSKDRHILAAAVAGKAQVLVTNNLKHFPAALLQPFGIKPMSPDDFLVNLFYFNREIIREVLIQQSEGLHNPARTVTEILDTLKQHAPNFVNLVQRES